MAELHRFQDLVRTPDQQSQPISSRLVDENFKVVRLKLSSKNGTDKLFTIQEKFPNSDELELSFNSPGDDGTYVLGWKGGAPVWLETEECD